MVPMKTAAHHSSRKVTGKVIGILKLNTHFPRLQGDIGNPSSFDFPTRYITIENAIADNITVADQLPPELQLEFIHAAEVLIREKVSLITTTCGFLSTMQRQLAELSSIPVICSALELLPLLKAIHGGEENIGVLTFNRHNLNTIHTAGTQPAAIEGLLNGDSLRRVISDDLDKLDQDQALREVMAATDRLLRAAPKLTAIVLECTNLSPYKQQIREHSGRAVYDLVDAINWLMLSH